MNNSKNCWTVYCHTTPSGKRYIGITSRKPDKRWHNGNGYRKNKLFNSDIEKYGWENIKHDILDTNLDEFTAKCLEEYYIFSYRTYVGFSDCNGYNCTLGGEGTLGYIQTEETRRKQSEANKGKPSPRKGIKTGKPAWNRGLQSSKESRRKNSEAHKGQIPWNKGIHRTEEEKMNISASLKGKHWKLIDGKHVWY